MRFFSFSFALSCELLLIVEAVYAAKRDIRIEEKIHEIRMEYFLSSLIRLDMLPNIPDKQQNMFILPDGLST